LPQLDVCRRSNDCRLDSDLIVPAPRNPRTEFQIQVAFWHPLALLHKFMIEEDAIKEAAFLLPEWESLITGSHTPRAHQVVSRAVFSRIRRFVRR